MATVQCPGSNQVVAEANITEMPDQELDEYNHLIGTAGRATCETCGKNVGMQTRVVVAGEPVGEWGRLARHSRPEEQVQPEYVEPEEEEGEE